MRFGEKGRKKFYSRIPFILDPGKKIPKKIAKTFKNILGPNNADTRPRQENSKKNSKKIQKI